MTNVTTTLPITLVPGLEATWRDVDSSFERFCLAAGIDAMEQMLCEDHSGWSVRAIAADESALATAGA